ncbi:hypothetical protein [Duganella sp. Root198D2]|uniref:hypothetical protein n=1 Tax=Duganella sp. Root198D2 TaxID=1736489 RepID=UPI00070BC575|nr:hypothetical protein [Duganella sp. Root198D2]KRB92964.1 hypothetical protein ASE26_28660 [Duganella sp. Root198D2]
MSYQIQLASVALPEADLDVFPFINKLRQDSGGLPPSASLQRFHDALLALFPDAPWSDSHFAGDAGRLAVTHRRDEVVPHVLYLAGEFGLAVVDNQTGKVHRPASYQVVLEGPAPGVALGDAANRLAALMNKPITEMLALLSGGRRKVVKKGVPRSQAQYYVDALKERAGCHATLAAEHDREEYPKPPPPNPVPARPAQAKRAPAAGGLSLQAAEAKSAMPPRSREPEPEPYAPADSGADARLFMLADGLRLTVFATVLYLVSAYFIRGLAGWPRGMLALVVTVLAMAGVYRLSKGAGSNIVMRILAMIFIIIPLANILVLLLLIRRGKVALRENEVGTGWFGASYDDIVRLRGGSTGILPSTTIGLIAALGVAGLVGLGRQAAEKYIDAALGSHPQPCAIVGIWESSKLGPNGRVLMRDDGNYFVLPLKGQEDKVKQEEGEWSVRNRNFVWQVPLADKPWMKVERIETFKLSLDGQTLTIFEPKSMGLFTEWRRAGAMKSARCGFN